MKEPLEFSTTERAVWISVYVLIVMGILAQAFLSAKPAEPAPPSKPAITQPAPPTGKVAKVPKDWSCPKYALRNDIGPTLKSHGGYI